MANYIVSPTDPLTPTNQQGAKQGAEEFRALKGYISSLLGFPNGFNVFRKNAIIGGDFSTNPWQRGVSFAGVLNSTYTADRWFWAQAGSGVVDISKLADAPTVAQIGRLTNNSLLIDVTTIDAAIAASDIYGLFHVIEGYNFLPLAQNSMVLSFWHKHTKVGTYCVGIQNSGSDRSYVGEYTQAVSDVWELAKIPILASPSAGTWNYTNGYGLSVFFVLASGSSFQTTSNVWQTGNFFVTANQVNALDSVANNFRIALVQLESGSAATPFEQRTVQEELALCQRYYEKSWDQGINPGTLTGIGALQSSGTLNINGIAGSVFNTVKRVAPIMVIYNPDTGAINNVRRLDIGADVAVTGIGNGGTHGYGNIQFPGTVVNGASYYYHYTASAEL